MAAIDPDRPPAPASRRWGLPLLALALLAVALAGQAVAARNPELVEERYSRGLFPLIVRVQAGVSGRLPVSVAELLVVALGVRVGLGFVRTLRRALFVRRVGLRERAVVVAFSLLRGAALAAVLYAVYLLCWGLNHHRVPFAQVAGWEVSTPSSYELASAAASLADELVELREGLAEDEHGVSVTGLEPRQLERFAAESFEALDDLHPGLERAPARAKRALASPLLSAAWISGIYSPFTGEAHVNAELPEPQLGFVTAHELAHSLGFAREDEANFLGYLACTRSDSPALRYSGLLAAWRYLTNALILSDSLRWIGLQERLSDGVRRDLDAIREFWMRERSPLTAVAEGVNDTYLKSQGQTEGFASYGLAVNLLVADWRRGEPDFGEEPWASALEEVRERPMRVAFVGSCFLSGGTEPERLNLPERLVQRLEDRGVETRLLDLAACKQTSQDAVRAVALALDWEADVLVLEVGAGDLQVGVPLELTRQYLDKMIFDARRAGTRVLLLGGLRSPLDGDSRAGLALERLAREVAAKRGVPAVEDFADDVAGVREALRSDLEHPNSAGLERLATRVLPRLRAVLASARQDRARELVEEREGGR